MESTEPSDALWGVSAVARAIDRNERQTYYLLQNKRIRAKKVGAIWFSTRIWVREFFSSEENAA